MSAKAPDVFFGKERKEEKPPGGGGEEEREGEGDGDLPATHSRTGSHPLYVQTNSSPSEIVLARVPCVGDGFF